MPHVVHSVLPRVEDPVVRESYRRTGVVTPAQVHAKWFELLEQNPGSKLFTIGLFSKLFITIFPFMFLVTIRELVRNKEFNDLKHFKLVFSVGGGSHSTKEGALFSALKVNIQSENFSTF